MLYKVTSLLGYGKLWRKFCTDLYFGQIKQISKFTCVNIPCDQNLCNLGTCTEDHQSIQIKVAMLSKPILSKRKI